MPGLYGKYIIKKADGTPIDPEADYFVLRLDTDPHARVAALAYADSIEPGNPRLAFELRQRVGDLNGRIQTSPLTSMPKNGLLCVECGKPQYLTPSGATCGEHGGAEGLPPAMLEMPDGRMVPQNGPEDRATWWTCTQCGFTGPAVGSNPEGEHRCMGIICGGKTLNPTSPKCKGWRNEL
jgi:hypothetical protein